VVGSKVLGQRQSVSPYITNERDLLFWDQREAETSACESIEGHQVDRLGSISVGSTSIFVSDAHVSRVYTEEVHSR
jgi:hypothetical protein